MSLDDSDTTKTRTLKRPKPRRILAPDAPLLAPEESIGLLGFVLLTLTVLTGLWLSAV